MPSARALARSVVKLCAAVKHQVEAVWALLLHARAKPGSMPAVVRAEAAAGPSRARVASLRLGHTHPDGGYLPEHDVFSSAVWPLCSLWSGPQPSRNGSFTGLRISRISGIFVSTLLNVTMTPIMYYAFRYRKLEAGSKTGG